MRPNLTRRIPLPPLLKTQTRTMNLRKVYFMYKIFKISFYEIVASKILITWSELKFFRQVGQAAWSFGELSWIVVAQWKQSTWPHWAKIERCRELIFGFLALFLGSPIVVVFKAYLTRSKIFNFFTFFINFCLELVESYSKTRLLGAVNNNYRYLFSEYDFSDKLQNSFRALNNWK